MLKSFTIQYYNIIDLFSYALLSYTGFTYHVLKFFVSFFEYISMKKLVFIQSAISQENFVIVMSVSAFHLFWVTCQKAHTNFSIKIIFNLSADNSISFPSILLKAKC